MKNGTSRTATAGGSAAGSGGIAAGLLAALWPDAPPEVVGIATAATSVASSYLASLAFGYIARLRRA